ncbi:hypothetical protein SmJEL517_g01651 [Synchytrium microbalum]|uniref:Ubiquitin carboxyl-terminal hydrolase n=1 Tax=Synchytrium microbalum TaxID=1806994 RepID=A0A507C591_9FUNG|nr:uncharacterized protein SmJEL517_g01651 [Synchytrium microbalum]TPX36157.1 hypothetical protein SmJEL517_g01651 [Synchytrium microbalum]
MSTTCTHVANSRLKPPTLATPIYKDECTQCFDSQARDLPQGVDVCLSCFNGGCLANDRNHALSHFLKNPTHAIVLNIRRVKKPRQPDAPPPQKMTRLAITVENDEDTHELLTSLKCYACGGVEIDRSVGNAGMIADAVLAALSARKQSDIKAWEDEAKSCTHTENLMQLDSKKMAAQDLAHCALCELNNNLWLCLVCGSLGCGRKQWDASGVTGGNGHALQHFLETGHGVACKLGTVTPEGTADIYCYTCDYERLDPLLGKHLAHFGIDVGSQEKTEKSMAELQLEQNLKFDFSMTTEDGKQMDPLFGPGYTGLKNLGNSCYMASVLQTVFSLPTFRMRYFESLKDHSVNCRETPSTCFHCQMVKVADGLLSGRYSVPIQSTDGDETVTRGQEGITPAMFKLYIGKDHVEFSTMRQQDAYEFFQHLIRVVEQKERVSGQDPTPVFKFKLEQRLVCTDCGKVRYKKDDATELALRVPAKKTPVAATKADNVEMTDNKVEEFMPSTFEDCLALTLSDEAMEYQCPSCHRGTLAMKSTKIANFPEILVTPMSRFTFENWVLKKLNIPIQVPLELDLEAYRAHGLQPGEEVLPDEPEKAKEPQFDAATMAQLQGMGFPDIRCKRAILATGNGGADAAMNWLFEHMEDADIDDPLPEQVSSGGGDGGASAADITSLTEMGFSIPMAKKALKQTNNNMERAVDWLFSHMDDTADDEGGASTSNGPAPEVVDTRPAKYRLIGAISHKGTSPHCGHYVAHVYKDGRWVLFNDEKVVHAPHPDLSEGYVYIFERC